AVLATQHVVRVARGVPLFHDARRALDHDPRDRLGLELVLALEALDGVDHGLVGEVRGIRLHRGCLDPPLLSQPAPAPAHPRRALSGCARGGEGSKTLWNHRPPPRAPAAGPRPPPRASTALSRPSWLARPRCRRLVSPPLHANSSRPALDEPAIPMALVMRSS